MLKKSWEDSIPKDYTEKHTHRFTQGESVAEREAWLRQQMENATAAGIELLCHETEDGYSFAFKNFEHSAAFYMNVYGDPVTDREQIMHHRFPDEEVNPYWTKAAEMYLQHMGIDYDVEIEGNMASFAFDRFSESATFRVMADNGDFDRMAEALERSDSFVARMRRLIGGDDPSPQVGADPSP